ncbi:hypothetical protein HFO71_10320 [Rhizobium laguerreae]|uniref:hypothetical protein n=1 Tax=Rhizobium laguerreae TaxID=1076926 RepID=UPI001C90AE2D|nr:hypothetical protein [Rhizobium laguerreae]MBY3070735.1 hypothetical protein [Rhizobium laguerreae]
MKFWFRLGIYLLVSCGFGIGVGYFVTMQLMPSGTGAFSLMSKSMVAITAFAVASTGALGVIRMRLSAGIEIRIKTPAGHTFTRILTLFISKRLFYKHFGQTIADNREEVNKALARGDFEEADKIGRELNIDLVRQILELFINLPASIVGKVWQFAKGAKKGDE